MVLPRVDHSATNIYKKLYAEENKWKPIRGANSWDGMCSNVSPLYSLKDKRFEFRDTFFIPSDEGPRKDTYMFEVMSSALLLYRILCMFQCTVQSYGSKTQIKVLDV